MSERVVIENYNPRWVELFEAERDLIQAAIGAYILSIEHAGSTSIPGMAAKPVIDILVGLRSLSDTPALIAPMTELNYQYRPQYEIELPERRYFKKPADSDHHTHHVHMAEITSGFYQDHLLFRNYLRAHPEAAQEYARIKLHLAARFPDDREKYTDSKAEFIQEILRLARLDG